MAALGRKAGPMRHRLEPRGGSRVEEWEHHELDKEEDVTHGNCSEHQFRTCFETVRSIGKVSVEICNNCLSVVVVQKRDVDKLESRTTVELNDSAYPYVGSIHKRG